MFKRTIRDVCGIPNTLGEQRYRLVARVNQVTKKAIVKKKLLLEYGVFIFLRLCGSRKRGKVLGGDPHSPMIWTGFDGTLVSGEILPN